MPSDEVHTVPGHARISDGSGARHFRRGLGAHERHELRVHSQRPERGNSRDVFRSSLPHLLHPAGRAVGAAAFAAPGAVIPAAFGCGGARVPAQQVGGGPLHRGPVAAALSRRGRRGGRTMSKQWRRLASTVLLLAVLVAVAPRPALAERSTFNAMWLSIAHPGLGEWYLRGWGPFERCPQKKFWLGFIPLSGGPR